MGTLKLDLNNLAVDSFDAGKVPPIPAPAPVRTCMNTACPPSVCCA
jgi:hypothetical protein